MNCSVLKVRMGSCGVGGGFVDGSTSIGDHCNNQSGWSGSVPSLGTGDGAMAVVMDGM